MILMPIGTSMTMLPVLLAAMSLPAVTIAAVRGPAADDIYAVMGAVIASILAVMEAIQKRRDYFHLVSTFLGSAAIGALVPGPAFHLLSHMGVIKAESTVFTLWQTWAVSGFLLGLNGWWLIHKLNDRLKDFVDRFKK